MARRKRGSKAPKRKANPTKRSIPKALRTEAKRMREQGRIPRRLVEAMPSEWIDELFPDVDEGDFYE